jgi:surface protein
MFKDCKSLEELDVSNFDTSKVTNMRCMFYNCENLDELDLSDFSTRNVTDMHGMFLNCPIDFPESKFDREEVLDMWAAL